MRRLFVALVVMVGLVGCALPTPITPETPREKLVVAEAAYKVVILQVKSLIDNGIIAPRSGTAYALVTIIKETRFALDAWQLNPDDFELALSGKYAIQALQRYLRTLVSTQESTNVPCGFTGHPACAHSA